MAAIYWDHRVEEVLQKAKNRNQIAQARELAQHYRWRVSKIAPLDYSDRHQVQQLGADGNPTDPPKLIINQRCWRQAALIPATLVAQGRCITDRQRRIFLLALEDCGIVAHPRGWQAFTAGGQVPEPEPCGQLDKTGPEQS